MTTDVVEVTAADIAAAGAGLRADGDRAGADPVTLAVRRVPGYEAAACDRGHVRDGAGRVLAFLPLDAFALAEGWRAGRRVGPLTFTLVGFAPAADRPAGTLP